jgi:1-acyl-sn-glycerol-3-phosphate acyltransferase
MQVQENKIEMNPLWVVIFFWFFPERTLAVILFSIYIMGYLPWGALTWYTHALLIGVYCVVRLPESSWFRSLALWRLYKRLYFNMKYVGVMDKKKGEQVMYCMCPHGVVAETAIMSMVLDNRFVNAVPAGASNLFYIPIVKDFAHLAGLIPVTEVAILGAFRAKRDVILIPSGIRETMHRPRRIDTNRAGFARVAVRANVSVIPVYVEGADAMYTVVCPSWLHSFRKWMMKSRLRYAFPVLSFGAFLGFWPRAVPLTIHFGEPIPPTTVNDVRKAYYDFVHTFENKK